MGEFRVGDHLCRSRPLCAAEQWRLLHRLRPILPALQGMDHGMRAVGADLQSIMGCLAPLLRAKNEDVTSVFRTCVAACEIAGAENWSPLPAMPSLPVLMQITAEVINENFAAFFGLKRAEFQPIAVDGPGYKPVSMPDGEDWLFRPVLRGLCKAESLYDGTLHIEHLAKLHDAMDVEEENQARMRKTLEKK